MRAEIERSDNARSRATQGPFGGDWREPENYDIVLNTEFLPIETCVAQLQQLAGSAAFTKTKQSRASLADMAIEAKVRNILDTPFSRNIYVTVAGGEVTLSGAAGSSLEINDTLEDIRRIEAVTEVTNEVQFVPSGPEYDRNHKIAA